MTRLIDADALAEAVARHEMDERMLSEYEYGVNTGLEIADIEIGNAPTVQAFQTVQDVTIEVPVRHGKWVLGEYPNGYKTWECSVCGCPMITRFWYCPNCGAKMMDGEHETD